MKKIDRKSVLLLIYSLSLFGVLLLWLLTARGKSPYWAFVGLYFILFIINPPKRVVSLLTVYYLYYGLWFVFASMFGKRLDQVLTNPYYFRSIVYVYITFCTGMLAISLVDSYVEVKKNCVLTGAEIILNGRSVAMLYIFATGSVVMIILLSGGLSYWLANPGDAFLNRAGSGVYVILSHFFTMLLAAKSGYRSWQTGKKGTLILFLFWLVVTSPVHGSKLQIAMFLVVAFLPWLRKLRLSDLRVIILIVALGIIFVAGFLFRGFDIRDPQRLVSGIFYYFNTLDLLAVAIKDFPPSFLMTFFLPFNKFLTPFGLSSPNLFYDMNHFLTSIYFPEAWQIRATQQWPVETDLYLNFFFFGGLWVFFLYMYWLNKTCRYLESRNTLGGWLASFWLTMKLISHLRGSLYNHTDFYLFPMIFLVYHLLKRYKFYR